MRRFLILCLLLLVTPLLGCGDKEKADDLDVFLADYNTLYRDLWQKAEGSRWDAGVDMNEATATAQILAEKEFAERLGGADLIRAARLYLQRDDLTFRQRKQLEYVLLNAAKFPAIIPDTTAKLIEEGAAQNERLYGFQYQVDGVPVSSNDITEVLAVSRDLDQRLAYWEASKEVGPVLKDGLVRLRDLRNQTAASMGYPSFFALEVSEYGMSSADMMRLMIELVGGLKPLYEQLHCWTKYQLAARYDQPVPRRIPAHWLGNKWAQAWPGLVEGIDLDGLVADKSPEWMIEQGERYYVSMGFDPLPPSFWERSDLFALPAGSERVKNTHASAWHIDLDQDVRCLMSVAPTFDWLQTTHHELGHIYYYLAYSNPDVPFVLRTGANRAMHEGMGTLIELVSSQSSYLQAIDLLPQGQDIDQIQWLLNQALLGPVTFLPFACGTMTHWEHDFYEEPLAPGELNARWWHYAGRFQGINPPDLRGEQWCDPATKTHINDDAAQYYDYALSSVILHQLHAHICKEILDQPVQTATYWNQPVVGAYLRNIMRQGATRDWREVMRDATGETLSARALLDYYEPLYEWLKAQNAGRDVSFD
ncbi:MAG TPA: M2 family metallopeptidase [Candidatus Krumholzibacteria bacterium]|nr:M2 family metallopeptidase [Candidatus Krumholzibacteria bacterium]